jgi:hypothetical protein
MRFGPILKLGLRQLDAAEGREIDFDGLLRRARSAAGKS